MFGYGKRWKDHVDRMGGVMWPKIVWDYTATGQKFRRRLNSCMKEDTDIVKVIAFSTL
jgi:hypothetical protein